MSALGLPRWVGRAVGLDVHREFREVAICEDGKTRSAGRVPSTPAGIRSLAENLVSSDRVALEVTGSCWEVARILEPEVNRVVVVSPDDTGIITRGPRRTSSTPGRWRIFCGEASLRRCGCPMSAAGFCAGGWRVASSWCGLARARRTRSTRPCSAELQPKPPCSDLFGVKGRQWLAGLQLPLVERESVDAAMRHVEFLDAEIAAVERLIAKQALSWPELRRLMTVPGVNLICAASFIAAVGNPDRFMTSRKLVAYLGLDPRVKQSGDGPARSGRISKRGSPSARWALVEAAWTAVLQPGPLHAFYERTRIRRGHGKAIVATARKLAVLFWCMLTRARTTPTSSPRSHAASSDS